VAHEALCTNTYLPPGNNIHSRWPLPLQSNLLADIAAGDEATFRFYAADAQVNYLFNSHNYGRGNEPRIHVTAAPLPRALRILGCQMTNSVVRLTGLGQASQVHQIQASSDLNATSWLTLGTATIDTNGLLLYEDITAADLSERLYRLTQ
jgi:hypothetical protein